jgi:hypothetical protein
MSHPFHSPVTRVTISLCAAIALFGLSACSSPQERRAERIEQMGPPQVPLSGRCQLFGGSVTAVCDVQSYQQWRHQAAEEEEAKNPSAPDSGGRTQGEGHRGGRGGGKRGGGEGGGGPRQGSGGLRGAALREVLVVKFTNNSTTPVSIEVKDAVSILGNFAPRPSKFEIAPGATVSLEPMFSAFAATLEELDLTLSVASGGKTEKQTLRLLK